MLNRRTSSLCHRTCTCWAPCSPSWPGTADTNPRILHSQWSLNHLTLVDDGHQVAFIDHVLHFVDATHVHPVDYDHGHIIHTEPVLFQLPREHLLPLLVVQVAHRVSQLMCFHNMQYPFLIHLLQDVYCQRRQVQFDAVVRFMSAMGQV